MNRKEVSKGLKVISKTIFVGDDEEDENKFKEFVNSMKYTSNSKPFHEFHWFVYPLKDSRSFRLDFYSNFQTRTFDGEEDFYKALAEIDKVKKEYEIRKKKIQDYAKKLNLNIKI